MGSHDVIGGEKIFQENMKAEKKAWTYKKPDKADGSGKEAFFKVYDRASGVLLEGFEDKEFGSPLEGGRYFYKLLKEADEKASADVKTPRAGFVIGGMVLKPIEGQEGDKPISTATPKDTQGDALKVAAVVSKGIERESEEAREGHLVTTKLGVSRMFKIVIPKQSNTDMNNPVTIPNHHGGEPWNLERGKEYIVPQYVVSILKESIGTTTDYGFEISPQGVRTVPQIDRIPRFGLQILEEIRV